MKNGGFSDLADLLGANARRPWRFFARLGLRTRLFLVLLLAGAPMIVFGALEAQRNYASAISRDRELAALIAQQTTDSIAQSLEGRWQALELVAALPQVRSPGQTCESVMRVLAETQRFIATARIDRNGRIACASMPNREGVSVVDYDWWRRIQAGARTREVSSLVWGHVSERNVVVLAVPVYLDGFDGTLSGSIDTATIGTMVARVGAPDRAVFLFDRNNTLITSSIGAELAGPPALAAAIEMARTGRMESNRDLRVQLNQHQESGLLVAVVTRSEARPLGLRASLAALAPLLATLLGIAAMWAAVEAWVLRYFSALEMKAKAFAAGIASATPMRGAPPEFQHLAAALDAAFERALARERELELAARDNRRLSRELHHRVKNNLQVLTSLVNRQQKRSTEPLVRTAISEARARMLAIALVHRFIDPPEHLGIIDFDAYLTELTQQLHFALSGEARGIELTIDVDIGVAPVDFATVVGLLVAECFVGSYRSVAGLSGAQAHFTWRSAPRRFEFDLRAAVPTLSEPIDADLVRELARQAGAEVDRAGPMSLVLSWPAQSMAETG